MKTAKHMIIAAMVIMITSTMTYAGTAKASKRIVMPGTKVGFNPQPEPPGKYVTKTIHDGSVVGLGPQPEPPDKPASKKR